MKAGASTIRRRWFNGAAVLAALMPAQVLASSLTSWRSLAGPPSAMPEPAAPVAKVTRLRISGYTPLRDPPQQWDDERNYWSEAIEDDGRYYYRAKGITVEMTEEECIRVVGNPKLYYFSTALKLHLRIGRAALVPGSETHQGEMP